VSFPLHAVLHFPANREGSYKTKDRSTSGPQTIAAMMQAKLAQSNAMKRYMLLVWQDEKCGVGIFSDIKIARN
tara:strand:- start:1195 stop:1413 length:219 start_codon:yes stop_codon:yes gene_type:complete